MQSIVWFLHASSIFMILMGFVTYAALKLLPAPYGRYSAKGWGIMVPASLAWFIMETPNMWVTGCVYAYAQWNPEISLKVNITSLLLLSCFLIHYTNRSIIFPLKMNFTGNSSPMPFTVMFLAFSYCCWNGLNQALSLLIVSSYEPDYIYNWNFAVGITLFFTGFIINLQSDDILFQLKARGSRPGQKTKYSIPYGGFFEYVSCANFCKC